jgi:DNA polymerase IV
LSFADFALDFFPNDKKSGARRLRIEKFEQYGGNWIKYWNESATHIILEDNLTYNDLLKFGKFENIPSHVHVVDERFVSDCLSFRCVLDATQPCYRVRGDPKTKTALTAPVQEQMLPSSLTIKPITERGQLTPSPEPREASPVPQAPSVTTKRPYERPSSPSKQIYVEYNDELCAAIQEAKSGAGLLLDDSDEEELSGEQSNWKLSKAMRYQNSFACMHKSNGNVNSDNPNSRTIEILDEMACYYDRMHDNWRTVAYRKTVSLLKRQSTLISTKEDALKPFGIGERLAAKIEEIVLTNRLQRLDDAKDDPGDKLVQIFLQIYGVGLAQAHRWVSASYKSLDDLQARAKLTENQKVGVAHYDDFLQRIPRAEVKRHGEMVRRALQEIDASFEVTIGGSYRRGSELSGDIDLIITKPGGTLSVIRTIVLESLVPQLFKKGFLKVSLAALDFGAATGSKWHGASALPGSTVWRRLDLLLVSWGEMGAAQIYFTGNDVFNRSIRLLARRKGMRLNQCGLFKNVMRGKGMVKMNEGELVESKSEKRIFEILGVPWRRPEDRNC